MTEEIKKEKEEKPKVDTGLKPYNENELEEKQETIGRTTKLENGLLKVKNTITDLQLAIIAMYAGSAVFCYKNFNEEQYVWGFLTLMSTLWLGGLTRNNLKEKDGRTGLTETMLGKIFKR